MCDVCDDVCMCGVCDDVCMCGVCDDVCMCGVCDDVHRLLTIRLSLMFCSPRRMFLLN